MIIEIQTFRLAPGVSDEKFLAADATVQTEFYYQQEGLVRRTTARDGDRWCVVIFSAGDIATPDRLRELVVDLDVERYATLD